MNDLFSLLSNIDTLSGGIIDNYNVLYEKHKTLSLKYLEFYNSVTKFKDLLEKNSDSLEEKSDNDSVFLLMYTDEILIGLKNILDSSVIEYDNMILESRSLENKEEELC